MNQYDENACCNKCGSNDIAVRFVEENGYSITDSDYEKSEHMRRTCRQCGYKWNETPLDNKDNE